jgi:hypothetical protein
LANSDVKKRRRKQIHRSVVLTCSPYINEVKEKLHKRKKDELRKSERYVRRRLQLNSEDVFQEKLFHEE